MEYEVTNGQLTYKVRQVGEYMYNIIKADGKKLTHVDSFNKDKMTDCWSEYQLCKFLAAMNMWIKDEKKNEFATDLIYGIIV